jgi:hypothetical protein
MRCLVPARIGAHSPEARKGWHIGSPESKLYTIGNVEPLSFEPKIFMQQDTDGYRLVRADQWSGAAVMLVAAFCIFESWHLPFGSISAPDAGFFPRCLSALLLVFGAGVTLNALVSATAPVDFHVQTAYVGIAAAAFIAYAFSIQHVGYLICTLVILVLLMRGLCGMSWSRSLAIAIPGVVLSYLAFTKLGVPLPTGVLSF